jgi:crotonobetainyl-CoA:carnitine CoA-transferase CaiB-like acyl-CoA transferase
MAAPIMDMKDISRFRHYRERGLFDSTVVHPDEVPIEVPARFAKLEADGIDIRRPAPLLSEHTADILQELELSAQEVEALYIHEVI